MHASLLMKFISEICTTNMLDRLIYTQKTIKCVSFVERKENYSGLRIKMHQMSSQLKQH